MRSAPTSASMVTLPFRPLASMRRLCLPDRSRGGAETTSAQRQRFLCGSQAWIKAASLIDARPVYGRRVQFRVLGTFEVDAGGARSPSVGPIKHAVLANLLKTRESARYRPRRLRRTHAEDRLQGRVSLLHAGRRPATSDHDRSASPAAITSREGRRRR